MWHDDVYQICAAAQSKDVVVTTSWLFEDWSTNNLTDYFNAKLSSFLVYINDLNFVMMLNLGEVGRITAICYVYVVVPPP